MRTLLPTLPVAGALALSGAAAAVLLPVLPATATRATAPTDLADATLVQLTEEDVPVIGMDPYSGRYGTATSTTVPHTDDGDFSDPDGMLDFVTIATQNARTATSTSKYSAQAQLTDLNVEFNNRSLIRVGSRTIGASAIDSYAECVPPPVGPYALAYTRSATTQITVLGKPVTVGTTVVPINGDDLGVDTIGPSLLTVTVTAHQDPAVQSRADSASAWLNIHVQAALNGTDGQPSYQGPLTNLRLGEVHANCGPQPSPSPTDSPTLSPSPSPTDSPSPSPSPTDSPSPSPSPTDSLSPSPSPTDSLSPSPSPTGSSQSPHPSPTDSSPSPTSPPPSPEPTSSPLPPVPDEDDDDDDDDEELADTGTGRGQLWRAFVAVLLVASGAALYLTARRRASRRP